MSEPASRLPRTSLKSQLLRLLAAGVVVVVGLVVLWRAGVLFADKGGSVSGAGGQSVSVSPPDLSATTPSAAGKPVGLKQGQVAPDFVFSAFDGKRQRLSDYRGRPVLLNFWATWCVPCRAEMPDVEAALQQYAPQQLAALGVNNGEPFKAAQAFLQKLGVHFTAFAFDPQGAVARRYEVQGMPTSYFIDAQGVITRVVAGELTPHLLQDGIASAVKGFDGT